MGNLDWRSEIEYVESENGLVLTAYKGLNEQVMLLDDIDGIPIVEIGSYAFANNNICSVDLPSSVTSIGSWAFSNNCLTDIELPAGVSISGGTFSGNDITDSSAFIYKKNSDGTADYSSIVSYAGNKVNNLTIPETKNGVALKRIEGNAFSGVGLTGTLTIPSTVTYIGGDAFAFNSITNVILPEGLKTIDAGAYGASLWMAGCGGAALMVLASCAYKTVARKATAESAPGSAPTVSFS